MSFTGSQISFGKASDDLKTEDPKTAAAGDGNATTPDISQKSKKTSSSNKSQDLSISYGIPSEDGEGEPASQAPGVQAEGAEDVPGFSLLPESKKSEKPAKKGTSTKSDSVDLWSESTATKAQKAAPVDDGAEASSRSEKPSKKGTSTKSDNLDPSSETTPTKAQKSVDGAPEASNRSEKSSKKSSSKKTDDLDLSSSEPIPTKAQRAPSGDGGSETSSRSKKSGSSKQGADSSTLQLSSRSSQEKQPSAAAPVADPDGSYSYSSLSASRKTASAHGSGKGAGREDGAEQEDQEPAEEAGAEPDILMLPNASVDYSNLSDLGPIADANPSAFDGISGLSRSSSAPNSPKPVPPRPPPKTPSRASSQASGRQQPQQEVEAAARVPSKPASKASRHSSQAAQSRRDGESEYDEDFEEDENSTPFPPPPPPARAAPSQDSWEGELRPSLSAPAPKASPSNAQQSSPRAYDPQLKAMESLSKRHPYTWSVTDVGDWVDYISLGQYRRKVLHYHMNGAMLMHVLDAPALLDKLGVVQPAHRRAFMEAVKGLNLAWEGVPPPDPTSNRRRTSSPPRSSAASSAASPSARRERPASASRASRASQEAAEPVSKLSVQDMRARLMFSLARATAKAEQSRVLNGRLAPGTIALEREVTHVRTLLADLETQNAALLDVSPPADATGRVVWRPNSSRPPALPRPRPASAADAECTFKPTINPTSRRILQESRGGDSGEGAPFLSRLANDLRKRKNTTKELDRKYYSQEAIMGDQMIVKKQFTKDFEFMQGILDHRYHLPIGESPDDYEGAIDAVFEREKDVLKNAGVVETQVDAVLQAKGEKKLQAAASAFRTVVFMERYKAELRARESRLNDLREKYWEQVMGPQKSVVDEEEAAWSYFAALGWDDADTEAGKTKALALIRRALAYKHAVDDWKDTHREAILSGTAGPAPGPSSIDWSAPQWRADGLDQCMARTMGRVTTAHPNLLGPKAITKLPRAPEGEIEVVDAVVSADHLTNSVKLLSTMREEDLLRVEKEGTVVAAYRALRVQKFIEFTMSDIKNREEWLQEAYDTTGPFRKTVDPERFTGFLERQGDDVAKRTARLTNIHSDRMTKQAQILASSAMYRSRNRPHSAHY